MPLFMMKEEECVLFKGKALPDICHDVVCILFVYFGSALHSSFAVLCTLAVLRLPGCRAHA
jgi:hypothetical protein